MKRLAQLFLSVLFVITVSTVYFAFDLAVSNMVRPKKYSIDKHDGHRLHQTSTMLSFTSLKVLEGNLVNHPSVVDSNHRKNHSKRTNRQNKAAPFHKSRTGVKINAKGQEKLRLRTQNKLDSHKPPL